MPNLTYQSPILLAIQVDRVHFYILLAVDLQLRAETLNYLSALVFSKRVL